MAQHETEDTATRAGAERASGAERGAGGERPAGVGSPEEALRRLGGRLEQASDVAERLIAQVTDQAASRLGDAVKPPPQGWQAHEEPARAPADADVALLLQSLRELVPRELVPADLQQRLADALRELLLAARALIDWYLERLEQRRAEPVQVEDIPVL